MNNRWQDVGLNARKMILIIRENNRGLQKYWAFEYDIPSFLRHVGVEITPKATTNIFVSHNYSFLLYSFILHARKNQMVVHIFSIGRLNDMSSAFQIVNAPILKFS